MFSLCNTSKADLFIHSACEECTADSSLNRSGVADSLVGSASNEGSSASQKANWRNPSISHLQDPSEARLFGK